MSSSKLKDSANRPSDEEVADAVSRALASLAEMTPEEDARLTAAAESDPDNPPLGDDFLERARPAWEAKPELVEAWRRRRGRPKATAPKEQVTLRLSPEVLTHFRAGGPGWQTRIDEALKRAIADDAA